MRGGGQKGNIFFVFVDECHRTQSGQQPRLMEAESQKRSRRVSLTTTARLSSSGKRRARASRCSL